MSNSPLVLRTADQTINSDKTQYQRLRPLTNLARCFGFSVSQKNGVVLAIESTDCFALPSSQVDLSQFKNAETLSIALEEHLPFDAEDMLVSTVKSKSTVSLTIVSDRSLLVSEVERLEANQHWIATVSCTALLAVQELAYDSSVPVSFDCLWRRQLAGWDLVRVRNGLPIDWQWIDESEILANGGSNPNLVPLFVQGALCETLSAGLRESRETVLMEPEADQSEFAARMASRIVRGTATPWVNLAGRRLPTREPWAPIRIPLLVLLGILSTALIVFQGALLWQSSVLNRSAIESDDQQIAAFRNLYPGQKIPTDVVGLLRSEQRRLQLSREEMNKEPPVFSALPVLSQFLNSLPDEAEFRVDHVKAQSNQIVSAEGATRTLGDYKSLITSIREAGFEFQQPNVGNMADGFTVRLEKLTLKPH